MAHHDPSGDEAERSEAGDSLEVTEQSTLLYRFGKGAVAPMARLVYRPKVRGRRNVPLEGPLILASNHQSFIDSVAIPMVAPRRVQFLAKSSYFEGTGANGAFQRAFFSSVGAVPVERGAGAAAQDALEQSRRIIESGNALALYPEGTRSLDGRLYKGRTGVAWLALTTGAQVVPVGLKGTDKFLPVGAKVPRLTRISIEFGAPLDFSHLGGVNSGHNRREVTDEIMAAIQALTGQEEAGVYNESPPSTTERIKRVFRNERNTPTLPFE